MIDAKITISEGDIKRRLGNLSHKSGHVISRAANRSAATGKKVIKQEATRIYNINQKDVEKIFRQERATASHPYVQMVFRDPHRNLAVFGSRKNVLTPRTPVRSSDPTNPDPAFYKAKIMNGHHAAALNGSPKPFIQFAGKNKMAILLQRKNRSSRAPLRGVAAPAIPQILKNNEVLKKFNDETSAMFVKRLEHEIDQALKGEIK